MESSSTAFEHRSNVPIWNPTFDLDDSPLREDASISDFNSGRASYIANTIEQALLLPRDMDELRKLKKHELFLFVKRDLALVKFPYPHYIYIYIYIYIFFLPSKSFLCILFH